MINSFPVSEACCTLEPKSKARRGDEQNTQHPGRLDYNFALSLQMGLAAEAEPSNRAAAPEEASWALLERHSNVSPVYYTGYRGEPGPPRQGRRQRNWAS